MKYKDIDILELQLLVYFDNVDQDNINEFLEEREEEIIKKLSKNNITGHTEVNCDDMIEIYLDEVEFNHFGIHKFLNSYKLLKSEYGNVKIGVYLDGFLPGENGESDYNLAEVDKEKFLENICYESN